MGSNGSPQKKQSALLETAGIFSVIAIVVLVIRYWDLTNLGLYEDEYTRKSIAMRASNAEI